jgi:hypothetical protein
MNMRERMLAVIQGRMPDRVPFVQYDSCAAPNAEIWDAIGKNNMGILRWCAAHRFEHPNCRFEQEEINVEGRVGWRNTLVTPAGSLYEEKLAVPGLPGVTGFRKHYVETIDDYRVLRAYLEDISVVCNPAPVQKANDDLHDVGLPHVSLERTPYQQLWIQWVSIEHLSMHLADAPEVVEECMELLGDILLRVARAAFDAAGEVFIPHVVIGDNITAPLIGAQRFRQYCVPYYNKVGELMAEKGIPLFVHMDGDLKPLWTTIGESAVRGMDSLSPPPDNDTSVADAAAMWPEMRLLVNFPSSVHLSAPEVIYHRAQAILTEGGHTGRLQIQISENTPPGAWRTSYPQIVRAIDEFGAP